MRRLSWVLMAALLPMLTFMGHWPAELHIPGTGIYLGIAAGGAHNHEHDGGGEGHSQHCHGDSAGCSEAPATAGVSFGLMNDAVALAMAGGLLLLVATHVRTGLSQNVLAPDLRPPRRALSPA